MISISTAVSQPIRCLAPMFSITRLSDTSSRCCACNNDTTLRCSQCGVSMCSKKCQQLVAKQHKSVCRSLEQWSELINHGQTFAHCNLQFNYMSTPGNNKTQMLQHHGNFKTMEFLKREWDERLSNDDQLLCRSSCWQFAGGMISWLASRAATDEYGHVAGLRMTAPLVDSMMFAATHMTRTQLPPALMFEPFFDGSVFAATMTGSKDAGIMLQRAEHMCGIRSSCVYLFKLVYTKDTDELATPVMNAPIDQEWPFLSGRPLNPSHSFLLVCQGQRCALLQAFYGHYTVEDWLCYDKPLQCMRNPPTVLPNWRRPVSEKPVYRGIGERWQIVGTLCEDLYALTVRESLPAPDAKPLSALALAQRRARAYARITAIDFESLPLAFSVFFGRLDMSKLYTSYNC